MIGRALATPCVGFSASRVVDPSCPARKSGRFSGDLPGGEVSLEVILYSDVVGGFELSHVRKANRNAGSACLPQPLLLHCLHTQACASTTKDIWQNLLFHSWVALRQLI